MQLGLLLKAPLQKLPRFDSQHAKSHRGAQCKLAGSSVVRAAVLKERSVNDGLGLNGPPNLEEWVWLVSDWCWYDQLAVGWLQLGSMTSLPCMSFRYASLFASIPVLGLGGVCGWGFILKWEGFTRNDDLPEIAVWVEQKQLLYIFYYVKRKLFTEQPQERTSAQWFWWQEQGDYLQKKLFINLNKWTSVSHPMRIFLHYEYSCWHVVVGRHWFL